MDPAIATPLVREDLFTLLKYAVLPIGKVLVMCALGLLLASRPVNILPALSRRQLSKVRFRHDRGCHHFLRIFVPFSNPNLVS